MLVYRKCFWNLVLHDNKRDILLSDMTYDIKLDPLYYKVFCSKKQNTPINSLLGD